MVQTLDVTIGDHDRGFPGPNLQEIDIEEYIEHEDYNESDELENDIALLRFSRNATINVNQGSYPACKPEDRTFEGDMSTLSGWGSLFTGKIFLTFSGCTYSLSVRNN